MTISTILESHGVVLVQRVVPHYRVALFRRLYDELGWIVASGYDDAASGLNTLDGSAPWLRRYDFKRQPGREYAAAAPVRQIIRELRPHAVVAEFSLQNASCWHLAGDAAIGRGPRLAFWSQGWNFERGFSHPRDVASQVSRLLLMRPADAQISYSEEGAAYLRRWLPRRQSVFVAPNTVDMDAYPERTIDLSPGDPRKARLLCIGRVTPDKRMPVVVEAVARLRARFPGIRLTVIGDGPGMGALRAAARGLEANVTLLGEVYDETVLTRVFKETTLLVIGGSAGLNVNHALAHGVPVMLFDEPVDRHHPEHRFVEEGLTGYRVRPATAAALAARLADVLDRPVSPRHALAASIAERVAHSLSLDRMIEGFRALDAHLRSLPPRRR